MASRISVAGREDLPVKGVLLQCLAVLLFTCTDTTAKWLVTAGLVAIQVVFVRYAVHFALSLAVVLPREGTAALRSSAPLRQVARTFCLMGTSVFNFAALAYLPLTVTTTILFATPIAVTLLAIPMLGERVGRHRIVAVCLGFFGVLITMQPWGAGFHPAMLLNVAAMLCGALYFIITRMISGTESNATSQVWSSGIATLVLAPFAAMVWQWPSGWAEVAMLLLVGVSGGAGHTVSVAAHRLADASLLAPVIYLQLVMAAVASILVFGEWPTPWTLAGGSVIAAAGLYIWWRERHLARQTTPPTPRSAAQRVR